MDQRTIIEILQQADERQLRLIRIFSESLCSPSAASSRSDLTAQDCSDVNCELQELEGVLV